MSLDAIVIGAGWAGLSAADRLREAGRRVLVLEKARGPGGRSSTRRENGCRFDHGAQYFTARGAAFGRKLQQWRDAELVAPWRPRLALIGGHDGHHDPDAISRYVAMPGMSGICKALAGDLKVRYRTRVKSLRHARLWQVMLDDGEVLEAPRLVLTAPPHQAAELLGSADPLHPQLSQFEFSPCIAAMAAFDQSFDPGFDAAFVNLDSPLAWLARDSSKPGREGNTWVLHAGADWSASHLEEDFPVLARAMFEAFSKLVDQNSGVRPPDPELLIAHRWRYAQAPAPLDQIVLQDESRQLAIAGDWLAGNRVEGAWTSGTRAGDWLAEL
ncbi:MAG: NAD(P)/FAD-dependent oxidoreductase [Wenzhouxiangellaceae bacterium]